MELILFIATVLNFIAVCLNIYSYERYTKLTEGIINDIAYPEYYKDVWIYYHLPGESEELTKKVDQFLKESNCQESHQSIQFRCPSSGRKARPMEV